MSVWALPELVEAAARTGDGELARDALARLAETTQPAGTDFALGIEARCRALLADGDSAEVLYREAIERLERCKLRPDQARAHLLYGEWLRRTGRRVDAREQLRTAYDLFVTIGMEAFAERARRELMATGEKVRKRRPETRDELTPQEEQIARLARTGSSNPEIGAQLFIGAKTVEWHLGKVFTKLGISSRRQLRTAFARQGRSERPSLSVLEIPGRSPGAIVAGTADPAMHDTQSPGVNPCARDPTRQRSTPMTIRLRRHPLLARWAASAALVLALVGASSGGGGADRDRRIPRHSHREHRQRTGAWRGDNRWLHLPRPALRSGADRAAPLASAGAATRLERDSRRHPVRTELPSAIGWRVHAARRIV